MLFFSVLWQTQRDKKRCWSRAKYGTFYRRLILYNRWNFSSPIHEICLAKSKEWRWWTVVFLLPTIIWTTAWALAVGTASTGLAKGCFLYIIFELFCETVTQWITNTVVLCQRKSKVTKWRWNSPSRFPSVTQKSLMTVKRTIIKDVHNYRTKIRENERKPNFFLSKDNHFDFILKLYFWKSDIAVFTVQAC